MENLKPGFNKKPENSGTGASQEFSNVIELSSNNAGEDRIAETVARKLGIPFVDPLRANIEPDAVTRLDPDIAFETQSIPVRLINNTLLVAMASPGNEAQVTILKLFTKCSIQRAAAPKSSVSAALQAFYGKSRKNSFANPQVRATSEAETKALTVSVISNKGGVGKTHFSINSAYALARTGAKVLLIDADLGNADISNKLGIFPKQTLLDFLEKKKKMQDLVVRTEFDFDLICSKFGDFKLANLNYQQKIKFVRHFRNISMIYDFIIFDLGAGISRTVLDFALAADRTVIVTTPQDIISAYACAKAGFFRFKEIEERLEGQLSDYTPQWCFAPMLVVNQTNHKDEGLKIHNTINRTANDKININESRFRIDPEYLGSIPYDRKLLRTAELRKRPLLLDTPHASASRCIEHMSKKFLNPDSPLGPKTNFSFPFRRFIGIFTQKG